MNDNRNTSPRWLGSLRPFLLLRNPDPIAAIEQAPVPHALLQERFRDSGAQEEPDTFVLYRIIGNDLHPRHRAGQSLENLEFVLRHEPPLESCEKRWVVNRIVDPAIEQKTISKLHEHKQKFIHLPFVREDYAQIGLDFSCLPHPEFLASRKFRRLKDKDRQRLLTAAYRLKNNYVMNNNGARNAALDEGRGWAKWVLPFDGNCFFTASAWGQVVQGVQDRPWLRHFVVPMARILDNQLLMDPGFAPTAIDEPQICFRRDSSVKFNEAFPYGRRPKVELFWHLGIPGPWDKWKEKPWDQPRRPLSEESYQFGVAGWVARLFSGVPHLEEGKGNMPEKRGVARQQAILTLLQTLDEQIGAGT